MVFDIRLKQNFKLFLSGPSGCGKTTLIVNIIESLKEIAQHPPESVVYFFKEYQPKFDWLKKNYAVIFLEDNERMIEQLRELKSTALVIFDDMINSDNLKLIAQLFTVHGRHLRLSLAFLSQRLFSNNEFFRQVSQNADYLAIFKNPRNAMDIRILGNQMTPKSNDLVQMYQKATEKPYSYIFINLTQEAIPQLKFLSNIFTCDNAIPIYVLTDCK